MRCCLRLLLPFLAILAACGGGGTAAPPSPSSTLSLLPATLPGRIEAALQIPDGARLSLAWKAGDPQAPPGEHSVVEVWLQKEGEKGELIRRVPFAEAAAVIDLADHAGEPGLLRVTAGQVPVAWTRADLSGGGEAASWRTAPRSGAPDVVVYLIDTLRPDVLGAYGGPGPTPTLDRLASEGVVFERAYSTTSWTRPAVASLFSSLPVSSHGVANETFSLPDGVLSLAERLRLRGYQTMGVVANGHVLSLFNFDQGFEVYDSPPIPVTPGETWDPELMVENIDAAEVHALALRHLAARRDRSRPLFLYVHVVDPHNPYHPPQWLLREPRPAVKANNFLLRSLNESEGGSAQVLRDLALSYRGAVAYADQELGRFLGALGAHLDLDRTLLAVTSDHGEGFYEHHLVGHRHWLFEEMVRVPLILRGPGLPAGRRDAAPASLVDIAPTLLGLVDGSGEPPRFAQGRDLLRSPAGNSTAFSEFDTGVALVQGEWKLTYHQEYPEALRFALFNLREDPAERRNRFAERSDVAGGLESGLRGWRASAKELAVEPLPVDVDRLTGALRENLRALGYLR